VIEVGRPISNEKRADIIRHMEAGESKESVAKWLFICVRTVTRIWNKYRTLGSYEPEPQRSGRKPLVSEETMNQVVEKIKVQPDITLSELINELGLPISESALCRRLIKLGYSLKKRQLIQQGETARMSKKSASNS
jgi:transposase